MPGAALVTREGTDRNMQKGTRLLSFSERAVEDLFSNFWHADEQGGHFQDYCMVVVWEVGMALIGLETAYLATEQESLRERFTQEWRYLHKLIPPDEMTAPHSACNPACDDAAWTAMTLMTFYRMTGDEEALRFAARTVRRSYDFWQDGHPSQGLWYRFGEDKTPAAYGWHKSVYCAGLLLSALEYQQITAGTPLEDPKLLEDTLSLYRWVEQYLRRDGEKRIGSRILQTNDKLYYTDFTDCPSKGIFEPTGCDHPQYIYEAGSCSSLFGNTAMAAINALLFDMSGDNAYLTKAVETANALALPPYNHNGVFLNDRDAWTNAAFMGAFTRLALTRSGISPQLLQLVRDTGLQIAENCRTPAGYYRPEWSGGCRWTGYERAHTKTEQLNTTATSAHMIFAAGLAEKLGLF